MHHIKFSVITLSILVFAGLTASCTFPTIAIGEKQTSVRFECGTDQVRGRVLPATIARSGDKSVVIIHWNPQNTYFGPNWSPQKRCEEVSARFQKLYNRDGLQYITADVATWLNGRVNIICGVKTQESRCQESDLLFTLESKDDPNEVLSDLIALRERPKENKPLTRGSNFDAGRRIFYNIGKELETLSGKGSNHEKKAF